MDIKNDIGGVDSGCRPLYHSFFLEPSLLSIGLAKGRELFLVFQKSVHIARAFLIAYDEVHVFHI